MLAPNWEVCCSLEGEYINILAVTACVFGVEFGGVRDGAREGYEQEKQNISDR